MANIISKLIRANQFIEIWKMNDESYDKYDVKKGLKQFLYANGFSNIDFRTAEDRKILSHVYLKLNII